ncbi:hypothetical protein [Elioraea sp.]|uniref:hypothetical protein n=1 Tax=Elioraea sp. TaxID=2185103 RepID=UPI003F71F6B5
MSIISITAEAGRDICSRIASGELEVAGIQVREAGSKQIRYILRGLENLPADRTVLDGFPPLAPLLQAIGITQLLGVVAVAQNAATALSLRRIERDLAEIKRSVDGTVEMLRRFLPKVDLITEGMRSSPLNRLESSVTAAVTAHRHGERSALIGAMEGADWAAREIRSQAQHLVDVVDHCGLPWALTVPAELANLIASASRATYTASSLHLALNQRDAAEKMLRGTVGTIERMRSQLHSVLTDPELMLRRLANDRGNDGEIIAAGKALRDALHICRGREMMIRQGLISSDPERVAFERVEPVQDVGFVEIRPVPDALESRAS